MTIEIVDLPIENGGFTRPGIFYSSVSLLNPVPLRATAPLRSGHPRIQRWRMAKFTAKLTHITWLTMAKLMHF